MNDRIVQLVCNCLVEVENFTQARVEELCREHPDQAAGVRERIDALRAEGLPGPSGPISGDLEAATADLIEESIGPFRLLEELGRGGQAVVYLAEDMRLHRRVALKVLTGFGPVPEAVLKRFWREAEVASKLDHPGICAVFEAGEESGIPYIAMRYVEGVPLAEWISRARESAGADGSSSATRAEILETVEIVETAARALHAAHEAGVIHRDVKPRNIMVTPAGDPVLLDFGLAGITTGDRPDLTRTGEIFGTPAYMSPEQVEARHQRLDRRTDVYSLGATLYECVTLAPPFDAPTREGLYRAVRHQDPADPRRRNPRIPSDLKVVLQTALEKDREHRFPTALDFAEDLRRVREGKPIKARPVSAAGRLVRWARRRPARAALVITLALGLPLITGLVGFVIANRPAILAAERALLTERVERYLEEGYFALGDETPERAFPPLEAALAIDPGCVEAIGGKAMAYLFQKRAQQCQDLLDRNAYLVHANPSLLVFRAAALRWLGQEEEAKRVEARIPEPDSALTFFQAGARTMKEAAQKEDITDRERAAFRRAVDAYSLAILTAPTTRPLYHFRHASAAGKLREENSARLATQTLSLRWKDSFSCWRLAGVALQYVDPEKAINAFGRMLSLRPDYAWGYNLRGIIYCEELNQQNRAAADFRKALSLQPDLAAAQYHLGVALRKMGREEESMSCYEKAIRLDPDHFRAHFNLGSALRNRGLIKKAIPHMEKAVALRPDHALAQQHLGKALTDTGRPEEGNQAFKRAVTLNPNDFEALNGLGRTHQDLGRAAEAIAAYEKAMKLKPDSPVLLSNLAIALWADSRLDEAIAALRKAVKIDPGYIAGHFNLGLVLDAAGRHREAIDAYRKSIELKPDLGPAHKALGYALIALQDRDLLDEIIAAFEKAVELIPEDHEAYRDLGVSLFNKGQHTRAVEACRKSLALKPDYAEAHCNLGQALMGMGKPIQALRSYRRGHALGSKLEYWRYPSADWVRNCEKAVLRAVLREGRKPEEAEEWILVGKLLARYEYHAAAARTWQSGFKAVPGLAGKHRHAAARSAALSGSGKGRDARRLEEEDRAELRRQAVDWLRQDLAASKAQLEKGTLQKNKLLERLQGWKNDHGLTGIRDAAAFVGLPALEQNACRALWKTVDAMLAETDRKPEQDH